VVAVNPGIVLGEMIPPRVNASMAMFLRLLEGMHAAAFDHLVLMKR